MGFSEKEIQDHIMQYQEELFEQITENDIPTVDIEIENNSDNINPNRLFQKIIYKRMSETLKYTNQMDLIEKEAKLKKSGDSTIRADFLGVNPEDKGISIIELKKSGQTERQAFTELLAYSNHLTSLFPTMSKNDIVLILIAPMKVRIVREAFLHTLLIDNKRIIAFTYELEDKDDINTLKLKPWLPNKEDIGNFKNHYFAENNFDVVKLAWEGEPYDNSNRDINMDLISSFVAQSMEERNIPGFCFTSHSYIDLPYPKSLVIVGMNPYSISYKNFLENKDLEKDISSQKHSDVVNLGDILGLELGEKEKETNYLAQLHDSWKENLLNIGFTTLNSLLKTSNGKTFDYEWGLFDWEQYNSTPMENVYQFDYKVFPTGVLKVLYSEILNIDYDYIADNGVKQHPVHGDIFLKLVESNYNPHFFNIFLRRMLGLKLEDLY